MTQVSGSVWRGSAASVSVRFRPSADLHSIGAASWRNRPWKLLLLELDYAVVLQPPGGQVNLDVSAGTDGDLLVEDVQGSLPLPAVDGLFAPVGWKGTAEFDVDRLVIRSAFPRAASGVLVVRDLTAAGPHGINIGSFELTLGEGAVGTDVITGRLRDLGGGPMQVRGTLELKPDRSYLLTGEVSPGSEQNAVITRTLGFLGPADSLGRRPFTIEGRL